MSFLWGTLLDKWSLNVSSVTGPGWSSLAGVAAVAAGSTLLSRLYEDVNCGCVDVATETADPAILLTIVNEGIRKFGAANNGHEKLSAKNRMEMRD